MDLDPRLGVDSQRLLRHQVDALNRALKPGWYGNAGRRDADLVIMLDHLAIGLVGIAPTSLRGKEFAMAEIMGASLELDQVRPSLSLVDPQGVLIVSVPVWGSLLPLATRHGLAIEINEQPDAPILIVRHSTTRKQEEDEANTLLALESETQRLRNALEMIHRDYGKVCPEFETCEHAACSSSVGAWMVADEALKETR